MAEHVSCLVLEHLSVRDVRNVVRTDIEPAPRLNVVYGNNGHGKTTLLEAIYFVATSRSFRTTRLAELVHHGAQVASVRARFAERDDGRALSTREQVAAVDGARCVVHIDGNRPRHLAEFATRSPIVVFHPDELALSSGPAALRRKLLDRIALFLDPTSADHRARYIRAHRTRQRLLRRGAVREVDAFEQLCATHGAALTRARRRAAAALGAELLPAFRHIAAPDLNLAVRYAAGGDDDPAFAAAELSAGRPRDAHRPSAGFGPHRDDLELSFDGRPVRTVASQGQHRAVTLALKAAEAASVALVRGVLPVLLLDDVSSELDPERTAALFHFLGLGRSQVFLTTTRPELIATHWIDQSARRDFRVDRGTLTAVST